MEFMSWIKVALEMVLILALFKVLYWIDYIITKKLYDHYLKKSASLEVQEQELLNRLNAKETQGK